MTTAIKLANERVYRAANETIELHGMGSTCVALLLRPGGSWIGRGPIPSKSHSPRTAGG